MSLFTENDYEQELIEKISSIEGYSYKSQEEIINLRKNLNTVILDSNLLSSIKRINSGISEDHANKVFSELKAIPESNCVVANKEFQKIITRGIKVFDEAKQKTITYKIIDDTNPLNNEFIITNQFQMISKHHNYRNQYPDMVIYMNGLPIIVFELKGLKENNTLESAYKQMKNYKEFLSDLFAFNAFNVIAERANVKFGSLTASYSRYQYWKGDNYNSSPDKLITDLLKPEVLIDVIKNFTFYTNTKIDTKIVASYHQYYGVRKATDRSIMEIISEKEENGKAGIFWHTQGSGKSFSMLFLVKQIAKEKPGTTFIIVTDRNDLDNQLYKTFMNAEDFIGQSIHQISSIKDLIENLKDKKQDGVYFTTVQKFTSDVGVLTDRDDILVISDEAHRSHNNIEAKLERNEEIGELVLKSGSALYLRNAFPRSTFIGFTGTPVEKEDVSTTKIFGTYIDKYLMTNAEQDGVVVPIRYESRKPELSFDEEQMEILVSDHKDVIDEIKEGSDIPAELTKKVNKSIQQLKNFIADPDRIKGIARDFVSHYETRQNILEGKVMFVALNRFVAYEYYKEILNIRPEWADKIKLIMTPNQQQDPEDMLKIAGSSEDRKRNAEEFKKQDSTFKIAIVVDMWLTGFDVPSLDAIYIDKPIKMHNLMQTIARTNRVYTNKDNNKNKEYGLVVDYIGLWSKLIDALSFYSGKASEQIISERDIKALKNEYLRNANHVYEDFGFNSICKKEDLAEQSKSELFNTLDLMLNKIYKDRLKQNYIVATKKMSKYLNEVISILTKEERILFEMLSMARSQIIKSELGQFELDTKENRLIRQLSETIKFTGTDIISEIESNPIFLSRIIDELQKPSPEEVEALNAKLNADITKQLINFTKRKNFLRAQNLSKKLSDLMNSYDNNYITMEELMIAIAEIQQEVKDLNSDELNTLGFTPEEQAFYEMLSKPVNELPTFDKEKLEQITSELLEIINDDEKVNKTWCFNNHLIQKVRKEMKVLMAKHGYPPKTAEVTTDEIISQIMHQNNIKQ